MKKTTVGFFLNNILGCIFSLPMQFLRGKAAAVMQCVQTSLCNHEDILNWRVEFLFRICTAYCGGMWCCTAGQTGIAMWHSSM